MSRVSKASPSSGRNASLLSRDALCSLIPHGGDMCLLERVDAWDGDEIRCSTDSHRDPANPLRIGGRLSAIHGLEYGAQAMAVHGALLARRQDTQIPLGYVAAVRDLKLFGYLLDSVQERLRVEARRLLEVHGGLVYKVLVETGGDPLMTARVTVMLRSGERT